MTRSVVVLVAIAASIALPAMAHMKQDAGPGEATSTQDCNFGPYIVFFEHNSAELTQAAIETLDNTVSGYRNCGGEDVLLTGHSDSVGNASYNLALSRQRAAAVRSYLVAQGISESRIAEDAYGETRPRVLGPDEASEPQNRRVEITAVRRTRETAITIYD